MDYLWTPWRFQYIRQARGADECIFCEAAAEHQDARNYVVYRGSRNFAILNRFPYTSGHLMIAPYEHVASLEEAGDEALAEMILLARAAERHLRVLYRPEGMNLGMNLGECAGAGVAGHIHLHVLPRWTGDSSFMTVVGETRLLPEELDTTFARLTAVWEP